MGHITLGIRGGISTAQEASTIKFGLEALPGVDEVHFHGESAVEVAFDPESQSLDNLLASLTSAGFDCLVLNGPNADDQSSEDTPPLGAITSER